MYAPVPDSLRGAHRPDRHTGTALGGTAPGGNLVARAGSVFVVLTAHYTRGDGVTAPMQMRAGVGDAARPAVSNRGPGAPGATNVMQVSALCQGRFVPPLPLLPPGAAAAAAAHRRQQGRTPPLARDYWEFGPPGTAILSLP